jgi:hypothetical protein
VGTQNDCQRKQNINSLRHLTPFTNSFRSCPSSQSQSHSNHSDASSSCIAPSQNSVDYILQTTDPSFRFNRAESLLTIQPTQTVSLLMFSLSRAEKNRHVASQMFSLDVSRIDVSIWRSLGCGCTRARLRGYACCISVCLSASRFHAFSGIDHDITCIAQSRTFSTNCLEHLTIIVSAQHFAELGQGCSIPGHRSVDLDLGDQLSPKVQRVPTEEGRDRRSARRRACRRRMLRERIALMEVATDISSKAMVKIWARRVVPLRLPNKRRSV